MASEHDVQQVWLGLLDAERMARYYQMLAVRMQRWHAALTAFVAFGATGVMGSLLLEVPDVVPEALAAAVAAAAMWSLHCAHALKATMLSAAADGCAELTLCWRDLWGRLEGLDEAEAWREVQRLRRRELNVTARVPASLAVRRRLNQKRAKETYAVLGDEYAVAS